MGLKIVVTLSKVFSIQHPAGNYDATKGLQSGLSVPIIQNFRSYSRLISGPNQFIILIDTYSMEIRIKRSIFCIAIIGPVEFGSVSHLVV